MQLNSFRLGAMALACAAFLAVALPAPHTSAQTSDDPAVSSPSEGEAEECGLAFTLVQSLLQDKLTMSYWLGEAYKDRTCLQQVADIAFEKYEASANDARAAGPVAVQTAFERRALDLVSANARLREFMLEIALLDGSREF